MKAKIFTLALLVFLCSANSAFSQKDGVFNKKMYLGINGAYHFVGITEGDLEGAYNIDLEFERQFHKHWGYTAGIGVFHLMSLDYVDTDNNVYSPSIYFEIPIGMKFYSKIINASMGIKPQLLLRSFFQGNYLKDDGAPQWMIVTYLTISKDFTVIRNFKMEPYIQGYLGLYPPLFYPSVGLRLKYEFNSKQQP